MESVIFEKAGTWKKVWQELYGMDSFLVMGALVCARTNEGQVRSSCLRSLNLRVREASVVES